MTYGDVAKRAKTVDFKLVNENLKAWIDQWNKILNQQNAEFYLRTDQNKEQTKPLDSCQTGGFVLLMRVLIVLIMEFNQNKEDRKGSGSNENRL